MSENNLYVACLDLTDKPCLVVGAGPVGVEKAEGLLAARADVRVVAPDGSEAMERLALDGHVSWERRPYRTSDLDDVFLVIAATANTEVNTQIHGDAESRRMLVNVADVPPLCNFILPAIVRSGPIAIAVSTKGASPALAQRMKREAAQVFDGSYAELAVLLEGARPWAKATLPTYPDRKAFFDDIVSGTPDPIELLRDGRVGDVKSLIENAKRRHAVLVRSALSSGDPDQVLTTSQ